jgi:hypothetical protein
MVSVSFFIGSPLVLPLDTVVHDHLSGLLGAELRWVVMSGFAMLIISMDDNAFSMRLC